MDYLIKAYKNLRDEEATEWKATSKRSLIGLLKTIVDNFNPESIEIFRDTVWR